MTTIYTIDDLFDALNKAGLLDGFDEDPECSLATALRLRIVSKRKIISEVLESETYELTHYEYQTLRTILKQVEYEFLRQNFPNAVNNVNLYIYTVDDLIRGLMDQGWDFSQATDELTVRFIIERFHDFPRDFQDRLLQVFKRTIKSLRIQLNIDIDDLHSRLNEKINVVAELLKSREARKQKELSEQPEAAND